ncbi:MAG: hypothetical protein JW753_00065 [Dehalococcoidia bacterium]|nr:hypothetical protein [Dehalococcoidia bacterium]
MKNRIAIVVGFVAAIVLLFTSASAVSAASEGKDRNRQIGTKERLTASDVAYLKSLPRDERREILTARGWREIVIPDQYESYQDLVPVDELATAYREALKASGSGVAKNEVLSQSDQMRGLDETLKAVEQGCMEKEDYIPFDDFKTEERWVPSAKDLKRNSGVVGGWGTSPGDGNSCDFGQSANGDVVLLKGSGLFPGVFCHAAIVTYNWASYVFSIGPDGDRGVGWNSRAELKRYSHASVQRVDTWPLSSNRRQTAADYAYKQLGKPYNWIFVDKWRTDAFYCSQLCWAAYYRPSPWYYKLDIDGVPDGLDFGAVAPDALWASWRTDTVTCSD